MYAPSEHFLDIQARRVVELNGEQEELAVSADATT
jgi:hypothetical protein